MSKFRFAGVVVLGITTAVFAGCSSAPVAPEGGSGQAGNSGHLVVYTPEKIDDFVPEFNKMYPDIQVDVVKGGSGELLARTIAEADAPQGDVWWGGGEVCKTHPQLWAEYTPPSSAELDQRWKSLLGCASPNDAFALGFVYNKNLVAPDEVPQQWSDLADPKWKGKIYMPNPANSSAGWFFLVNWVQLGGWDLVEQILPNLIITEGAQDATRGVADGEASLGLCNEVAAGAIMDSDHVGMAYPSDGVIMSVSSLYLIKGAPNEANGKLFIDWMLSQSTQQFMTDSFWGMRPTNMNVPATGMTPLDELKIIEFPTQATDEKDQWLDKWKDLVTSL